MQSYNKIYTNRAKQHRNRQQMCLHIAPSESAATRGCEGIQFQHVEKGTGPIQPREGKVQGDLTNLHNT